MNVTFHLLQFICVPKLLENPTDKSQRFSTSLWSDKQIKSIRQLTHHVEIAINNKKEVEVSANSEKNSKKELTEEYNLANTDFQKQL